MKYTIESYYNNASFDIVFWGYLSIGTLLTTLSIFVLSLKIAEYNIMQKKYISKFLTFISNNTLSIYYLHWIVGFTILNQLRVYIHFNTYLNNAVKTVFLVLFSALLGTIIKKIPILKKTL